jgi:hypothetical protein
MRKAALLVVLSCFAAAAAAQAPQPAPTEERAAAPRPRLNLKLDGAAQYSREAPREEARGAESLPSLGANARPMPTTSTPTPSSTRPYPKDTERGER